MNKKEFNEVIQKRTNELIKQYKKKDLAAQVVSLTALLNLTAIATPFIKEELFEIKTKKQTKIVEQFKKDLEWIAEHGRMSTARKIFNKYKGLINNGIKNKKENQNES